MTTELIILFTLFSVVNQVAFHTEGTCVASCSQDMSVKIFDIRSRQIIQHYSAHSDSVTDISFHPSGNYLLSASKDSSLRLWDLREGRLLYTLQGHSGGVNGCTFSPSGNFFASAGADRLVMVWKANLPGSGPIAASESDIPAGAELDWSGPVYARLPRPSPVVE